MARVFVTHDLPGTALTRLAGEHETTVWREPNPPTPEQLASHAENADALLSMLIDRVDNAVFDAGPDLKVVANYAVGVDNIDLVAAADHGVRVGNTPDVLTDATADLAWALLLAVARRLPEAVAAAGDDWPEWSPTTLLGSAVAGATLVVVGGGRIGRAVARRATGFDMRVIVLGSTDPLHPALAQADFVSLNCPLTDATRHLIDAESLQQMKPTAYLVNTARGPIVDQQALANALKNQQIAGAAIDVTDPEPLPADDPLWQAPNLVVTPHVGSATRQAREAMADRAVDNILAALAGEPMPSEVTPPRGER